MNPPSPTAPSTADAVNALVDLARITGTVRDAEAAVGLLENRVGARRRLTYEL